jgi:hypothetical protein
MNKQPFFNGPFNSKQDQYIPIHTKPTIEKPKEIKPKIPWKPVSVKSHKFFILESKKLSII